MIQADLTNRSDLPILFDCGRLFVRLGYHLFHAAFLFDGSHRLRSRALAQRLVRLARQLEPTAEAREVVLGFASRIEEFTNVYKNEWMYESVRSLVSSVNDSENGRKMRMTGRRPGDSSANVTSPRRSRR